MPFLRSRASTPAVSNFSASLEELLQPRDHCAAVCKILPAVSQAAIHTALKTQTPLWGDLVQPKILSRLRATRILNSLDVIRLLEEQGMELIFADPYYDSGKDEPGRFVQELKADLMEFDLNVEVLDANIGRGADWPVALVTLFQSMDWPTVASTAGPITLYFLGERIKKNGEAWLEIARGLKRLLSRFRPTRIDEKAALLVVIDELTKRGADLKNAEISVQIIEQVTILHGKRVLDKRPEAVYVIAVGLDGESYLFAVESNGTLAVSKRFLEPRLRL